MTRGVETNRDGHHDGWVLVGVGKFHLVKMHWLSGFFWIIYTKWWVVKRCTKWAVFAKIYSIPGEKLEIFGNTWKIPSFSILIVVVFRVVVFLFVLFVDIPIPHQNWIDQTWWSVTKLESKRLSTQWDVPVEPVEELRWNRQGRHISCSPPLWLNQSDNELWLAVE